jgi:twitching motility protein PilT
MKTRIHELLSFAVEHGASDLHLGAGEVPAVRIDGQIRRMDEDRLSAAGAKRMAYALMTERQKADFERHLELDFSVGLEGLARFRVNVFQQRRGIGMILRHVPEKVRPLESLGAPKVLTEISETKKGLVLVTGPTGSGKTTTLAAMVDHVNQTTSKHVVTIEDPIEYIHTPKRCVINQREVGTHTHSFAAALRSALREDPDIILVGELRDLDSISLAMTAAETGHLVFATLHTNTASEAVDRIVDAYPPAQQSQARSMLSKSLLAVIAQILLPSASGHGRSPAFEVLLCNPAIRNLIRENKLHQVPSIMQTAAADGMQTMEMAIRGLQRRRAITAKEAEVALKSYGGVELSIRPVGRG